jgi:hypothetical protein
MLDASFPYGRLPAHDERTRPRLKLGPALRGPTAGRVLPDVPAVVDYLSRVTEWPMYLNDRIGDCTVAAAAHMVEAATTYGRGRTTLIGDADVVAAYSAVSGYDPVTGRNDNGAVMQDVLDLWRKDGIGGHRILAFAAVDVRDPIEVAAALYLFGHLYVGMNVPLCAEDQFATGKAWDTVLGFDGGNLGGHAVNLGGIDPDGSYRLVTWGRVQPMTRPFWRRYVEEAWVVVTPEWLEATGGSPEGLDAAVLGEAYTALTGQPSPFPDRPTPPPAPGPVPAEGLSDDLALVTATAHWVGGSHRGEARRVAEAIKTWRRARDL